MLGQIKTLYEFQDEYHKKNPGGKFFDDGTLKFFGERWSEMRLLKSLETVTSAGGDRHLCYVISSIQHKHPDPKKQKRRVYHYFDHETLKQVIT